MALFTVSEVKAAGRSVYTTVLKSANQILKESARSFSETKTYHVFLSHSIRDEELILGVKVIIEKMGYSVYVDWIEDPQLDRSNVTPQTANHLRVTMKSCRSLFFAISENSPSSKWMPWELGYFDALKGRVAILPIVQETTSSYSGQEYLGLYPYVDKGTSILWIQKGSKYVSFSDWLNGKDP